MPEGKGTYGSQVGRPSTKKKKPLKKFKALVKRATDPRGTKAHDKDPKGKKIGKTTEAGKKFIKKQATLPFARKKPDPESANKLMKKLNKGK